MRTIVWYISVTLLLFMLAVMVLQLILFIIVWPFGWSFWLLPNFTSDTAPLYELFTPVYTLEKSTGSHPTVRISVIVALALTVVYVGRLPPSEFEGFLTGNKKIIEDLYSGALLTDGASADGSLTLGGTGRYNNPLNPFGAKFGPGRYGSQRHTAIPNLADFEKETALEDAADGVHAEDLDEAEGGGGTAEGRADTDAEQSEGADAAASSNTDNIKQEGEHSADTASSEL